MAPQIRNDIEGKPREYWFETNSANKYKSFAETTFAKLRVGSKPGALIGIRTSVSNGGNGSGSTLYVYEWADVNTSTDLKH